MLFKGLCNVPRIGMHMYILVQTRRGNFVIISSVKMQLIAKHKKIGIYQTYARFIWVIYQCCLGHGITLERIITTYVKTLFVYWKP
jgi:hypothetical protein